MADLNFAVNLNPSGEQNLGTSEKAWAKAYVSDLGTNPDGTQVVNVNYVSNVLSEIETGAIPSVPSSTTSVGDFVLVNASTSGNSVNWSPMTLGSVFTSNTDGLVPHPSTGQNTTSYILTGAGTWKKDSDFAVFTGATNASDGTAGLVKRPAQGDQAKFLCGNGSWRSFSDCSQIPASFSATTVEGTFTVSSAPTYLKGSTNVSYYVRINPGSSTYPYLSLSNAGLKIYSSAASTPVVLTSSAVSAPTVSATTVSATTVSATKFSNSVLFISSTFTPYHGTQTTSGIYATRPILLSTTSWDNAVLELSVSATKTLSSSVTRTTHRLALFVRDLATANSVYGGVYGGIVKGMVDPDGSKIIAGQVFTGSEYRYYMGTTKLTSGTDYAETRKGVRSVLPGQCVKEDGKGSLEKTTKRLEKVCWIVSDSYGLLIDSKEKISEEEKLSIAVAGRVLAYPYESIEEFREHIGDGVCSGPNGTVSIMTEEEMKQYPLRIIGVIASVPEEEYFGDVKIDGRVWIKVI